MRDDTIEVTRSIAAPGPTVYEFLADYRNGRSRILPRKYFREMTVDEGGFGEGTRIRYEIRLYGISRRVQAVVEEPEPGRKLVEIDLASGAYTTFTVEDRGVGGCEVTIRTRVMRRTGLWSAFERVLARRLLRTVLEEELTLLGRAVRFPTGAGSPKFYPGPEAVQVGLSPA